MKINWVQVLIYCLSFIVVLTSLEFVFLLLTKLITKFLKTYLTCENVAQQQQLLQHGQYWVLQNYVKAENDADCRISFALTMQGSYEDIYMLELMYQIPKTSANEMYVSFAVYVPNELHYRRTMKAIAYARKCTKSLGSPIDPNVIQKYVSFHLYIPLNALTWSIPKNVSHVLAMQDTIDCGLDKQESTLEKVEQVEKVERVDMQEHAKIVGRNIAQLAAQSEFIINSDPGTYPAYGLMDLRSLFNRICSIDDTEYILRVPVVYMADLQMVKHMLHLGADLLVEVNELLQQRNFETYHDEFPRNGTIITKVDDFTCGAKHLFKTHFEILQSRSSFYYSRRNVLPLLPEHETLTLHQAENLRLYSMVLQNMKFVVPELIFMLHVNDTEEIRSSEFSMINESVMKQLELFYK